MSLLPVVSAFVVHSKRQRYLKLLESKRGIEKVRRQLAHFRDFDARFMFTVEPSNQTVAGIERLLLDLGARHCTVFSESATLDASDIPLRAALEKVIGSGLASILSCKPGILAYYEGEEPGERFILRKG